MATKLSFTFMWDVPLDTTYNRTVFKKTWYDSAQLVTSSNHVVPYYNRQSRQYWWGCPCSERLVVAMSHILLPIQIKEKVLLWVQLAIQMRCSIVLTNRALLYMPLLCAMLHCMLGSLSCIFTRVGQNLWEHYGTMVVTLL